MRIKHVISVKQFLNDFSIDALFQKADAYKSMLEQKQKIPQEVEGKILASLFYEPSTRTRFSFETAMQRLGGRVISTENAKDFSSAYKGETLHDTIKVIAGYADAIVIRHLELGAAQQAANASKVPVINAGDGPGEHPTQALLDLYTIKNELDRKDDFKIALIGDLLYGRTVHSLVYLLTEVCKNVKVKLISPTALQMPQKYKDVLANANIKTEESTKINDAFDADILYVTRIQKERFPSIDEYNKIEHSAYSITQETLTHLKSTVIIMHPLPRLGEIDIKIDADKRAAYFRQAHNGIPLRMALLQQILAD